MRDVWYKTSFLFDQKQTANGLAQDRFDNYKVQLSINNMLDEKYQQAHEYSTMGRSFNFGIRKLY